MVMFLKPFFQITGRRRTAPWHSGIPAGERVCVRGAIWITKTEACVQERRFPGSQVKKSYHLILWPPCRPELKQGRWDLIESLPTSSDTGSDCRYWRPFSNLWVDRSHRLITKYESGGNMMSQKIISKVDKYAAIAILCGAVLWACPVAAGIRNILVLLRLQKPGGSMLTRAFNIGTRCLIGLTWQKSVGMRPCLQMRWVCPKNVPPTNALQLS